MGFVGGAGGCDVALPGSAQVNHQLRFAKGATAPPRAVNRKLRTLHRNLQAAAPRGAYPPAPLTGP